MSRLSSVDRAAGAARTWWPVLVPAAVMAGLALWGLARGGSLYSAECATFWAAHLSWPDLARLLGHVDAVHGLYYALVHVVFTLGHTASVMRLPSAVAAVAVVVLTYVLTARLGGSRWLAFTAAALTAVAPSMSQYAQSGRSYMLVTMTTLAASLALLRAVSTHDGAARRGVVLQRWLVYALLLVVCGYLHELSVFLLAGAHAVTLLWARVGVRVLRNWLLGTAGAVMVVAPLVLLSLKEDAAVSWITVPGLADVTHLLQVYFGFSWIVAGILMALTAVGALGAGLPAPPWLPRRFTLPVLAVPLLLLPPATLLLESRLAKPLYDERYVLFCLPAAMMLAAAGLARVAGALTRVGLPRLAWVPAALVLIAAVGLQWPSQQWLRTPDSRTWNLLQAARFLQSHARPGDGVDFVPRSYDYLATTYPWALRNAEDFRVRESRRQSGTLHALSKRGPALRAAMLSHDRIWLVGDPMLRPEQHGHHQLGMLDRHYLQRSRHPFHGGEILLFVRRPQPRHRLHAQLMQHSQRP